MTSASTDPTSLQSIPEAIVRAFVSGGKVRPVLPAGRRAEVVELLTRLVVSPRLLDAYCEAVTAERERQGVDDLLFELGDEPIPDAIAAEGFGGLSDEQLADFAIDAHAVRAIADWLSNSPDVEPGDWYIDAALAEQAGG